ncbi:hypothetical protein T45_07779 [Streptomyces turgidiscabies]|nr:hypothetical protein T45_07779 [Streptomyces turgidiscabies]
MTSTTTGTTAVPRLLEQLRTLPDDAFTRLQYAAPQAGCFNGCAMCSQGASRSTWGMTRQGLTGLLTAIGQASTERDLAVASGHGDRNGAWRSCCGQRFQLLQQPVRRDNGFSRNGLVAAHVAGSGVGKPLRSCQPSVDPVHL